MDAITQFDLNILHSIHEGISCGFLDAVFPKLTLLCYLFIGAAVVFLFFRKFRQGGAAMCGAILLSLLVGNLLLKNLVARDRPCWIDPDFLQLLVSVPKDFSFPSAHTMISVSAAAALFHYSKALGIPALVIAALVGFSRLYLFVHFPTDVLGGRGHRSPSCRCFVYRHGQNRGKDKEQKGSQLILPNSFRKEAVFALQAV